MSNEYIIEDRHFYCHHYCFQLSGQHCFPVHIEEDEGSASPFFKMCNQCGDRYYRVLQPGTAV